MADFNESLEVLDSWEGGYSLNPKDPGGETYCGISRRNWPNWAGWAIIDQKKLMGPIKWNTKFPELNNLVSDFYMDNFWNKQDFKDLVNQDVADKIFQHYVNMGNRAIKFFQQSINGKTYDIDGQLGQRTIALYNDNVIADGNSYIMSKYIQFLVNYYEELISEHPQFETFRHEWMLRAKTIGKRPAV